MASKMKTFEHPWIFIDIYLVEFAGKIYSDIIVTSISMALKAFSKIQTADRLLRICHVNLVLVVV
jgi:hypothetical protein